MINIKKRIKASRMGWIATKIGDIYSDPSSLFLFRLRFANKKSAILFGSPTHHNIGDHLLAYNEKDFLKKRCGISHIYEVPTRIYQSNRKWLKEHIHSDVPIFITGGGWMGDVWPEDQRIIENIISDFSSNSIIILPQTIYYKDINGPALSNARLVFFKARDLTIMCREEKSYDFVKKHFKSKNIKACLFPDMGLYQFYNTHTRKKGIGICLRDDREQNISKDFSETIFDYAKKNNLSVEKISTISSKPIPIWKRKYVIKNLIMDFAKYDVIVTDRLHGMIFALISGTRCIAIDNKTHKVKGVYKKWLYGNNAVYFMDDFEQSDITSFVKDAITNSDINIYLSGLKIGLNNYIDEMANYIKNQKISNWRTYNETKANDTL